MNTHNVFTAFDKNNKEVLLYRNESSDYIDLKSIDKKIISTDNIDLETLKVLSHTIHLWKHMSEKSVITKYNKDRSKFTDAKKIIFGRILQMTNLKLQKYEEDDFYGSDIEYKWTPKLDKYGLFIFDKKVKMGDYSYNLYKEIDSGEIFIEKGVDGPLLYHPKLTESNYKYLELSNKTLKEILKKNFVTKEEIYKQANIVRQLSLKKKGI